MADNANRARHAFGSEANIPEALASGSIDAYDILFLDEKKVGWITKDGEVVIAEGEKYVVKVSELPTADGKEDVVYIYNNEAYIWNPEESKCVSICKPTDLTKLESEVAEKADADEVENSYEKIKYEITNVPTGTLVNYGEKEIRVMVPADTEWVKQTVGATGNANMYYMGFKAYAPEDAVGFKEGDKGVIVDEYFDFNGDFAGTDEFGRNYSICWLALASYNETTDTWTYFGKSSTKEKYIGWDYIVEWYNADGVVIASDSIRIGLSNENCHYVTEPYYVGKMMSEIDKKIAEATAIEVVEF